MDCINYIKYKQGKYKYMLVDSYSVKVPIQYGATIATDYVCLNERGILTMARNYAWDGPSGPTIDTEDFMRGSLVHDALYQLMRLKKLDAKKWRKTADEILRDICREDGMSKFRSWYVYWGVRIFGGHAAGE